MFRNTVLKIHLCFILGLLFLITGCATPLMQVAKKGDINGVKALLDQGADVNESFHGETALMLASYYAHTDVVKLLIERGVNVNTMTQMGSSALGYAAMGGHRDVMKILIDNGANVDAAITGLEQHAAIFASYPEAVARNKMGIKLLEKTVKKQEIASQPTMPVLRPSQEVSPAIKSDVDELPMMQAKPNKNAYAIVIGIENYRQKLPKADYADNDARVMAEYLAKVMGYPEENVVTLTGEHATKSDFQKYIEKWLPNNAEKDSSVFIYYSGHGAPNPKTGDAFLVPYDGDPSFIEETGYPLKRLYAKLDTLQAKEIIVVLDSCFSGAGGRSVLAKGARPLVMNMDKQVFYSDRIAILSASSGSQISSTHDKEGHGLFTYFLLKGIKEGNSELGMLYNYLKPQVERIARKTYNNEQTPGLIAPKGLLNLRLYDR